MAQHSRQSTRYSGLNLHSWCRDLSPIIVLQLLFLTSTKATVLYEDKLSAFNEANGTSFGYSLAPPVAKKVTHYNKYHGKNYLDEYHWLRDETRKDIAVLTHLKKENTYSSNIMKPIEPLVETLYKEMVGRIVEDDISYPVTKGDYEYFSKSVKGLQYLIEIRRKTNGFDDKPGQEEVLLDLNKFTDKQLDMATMMVSPSQTLLTYTLDTTGSELYNIFIKDLSTGKTTLEIEGTAGDSLFWSTDSRYIFYTTMDDIRRTYRVYRHKLGDESNADALMFEEKDLEFSVGIVKGVSDKYLFLISSKTTSSEVHYLPLDKPLSNFTCFSPRQEDRVYSLEHKNDVFLILTNRHSNKKYINNYIMKAPVNDKKRHENEQSWEEVTPYNDKHYITSLYGLKDNIIIEGRIGGYTQIKIINDSQSSESSPGQLIEFPEPIYSSEVSAAHLNYNSSDIVYEYTSPLTPNTLYSFNAVNKSLSVLKKDEIFSGFNHELYCSERLFADNNVPISLVYRKDMFKKDGTNPLHLYGYGSYGIVSDPSFRRSLFSLLDRGFVYAIAHIRGGSEMGRQWYETEGKFLNKKNTFRDFTGAAEHLIKLNYTTSKVLSIEGASAGGLLIGAVVNQNPGLYNAAIAGVPFVDVINTMMDPSIPLTIGEYEEWGNPNSKEYFDYMLSYSPYDNLPKNPSEFPHMLVRAGLNDPRVSYWEPTKYVARLRNNIKRMKASKKPKVLQVTEMKSGHFGSSGRYEQYKELANDYAFLITTAKNAHPFKR